MIKIYTPSGYKKIDVDYHIKHEYEGYKTLMFTISVHNPFYKYIKEEALADTVDQFWNIKTVDEQGDTCNVECKLNLDDLKKRIFTVYKKDSASFTVAITEALTDTGWSIINGDLVSVNESLNLQDVTPLQVIEECRSAYGIVYNIDTKTKTLTVLKPENVQSSNIYITPQLNLKNVDYKGDSYNLVTKLYPYGKTDDKTGLTVNIASVNGGCEYIENHAYVSKELAAVWRDDRYTDSQSLYDDSVAKLGELCKPARSYNLNVIDIAKLNSERYESFKLDLYTLVWYIDTNKDEKTEYRVVELDEYPLNPENNVVTLSTVIQKIEGIITKINTDISAINVDVSNNKIKTNEIKRDLDTNILRVEKLSGDVNLKSSTYIKKPLHFSKNDIWIIENDEVYNHYPYYKKGEILIAEANKEYLPINYVFENSEAYTFVDNESLSFIDFDYAVWRKKVEYQTYSQMKQSINGFTFDMFNSENETNIEFTADGQDVYGGHFAMWDKPKSDITKKRVLFADENGNLYAQRMGYNEFFATSGLCPDGVGGYAFTLLSTNTSENIPFLQFWQSANLKTVFQGSKSIVFEVNDINQQNRTMFLELEKETQLIKIYKAIDFNGLSVDSITNGDGKAGLRIHKTNSDGGKIFISIDGTLSVDDITYTSDRTYKSNITKILNLNALSKIKAMNFYSYDLKSSYKKSHSEIGIIFDEAPEEIKVYTSDNEPNRIGISEYISLCAAAIKEAAMEIDKMKLEIKQLKEIKNG